MRIEEKLEKMKDVYLSTSISDEEVAKEWQMLENVLGEQQRRSVNPLFFRAFAFAAITLLLSGGVVTLAQASKPGEVLFPVKEFSQEVVKKVKKNTPAFINQQFDKVETPRPKADQPMAETEAPKKEKDGSGLPQGGQDKNVPQDKKVKSISDKKELPLQQDIKPKNGNHSQQNGSKRGEGNNKSGGIQNQGKPNNNSSKN